MKNLCFKLCLIVPTHNMMAENNYVYSWQINIRHSSGFTNQHPTDDRSEYISSTQNHRKPAHLVRLTRQRNRHYLFIRKRHATSDNCCTTNSRQRFFTSMAEPR